MMTDRETAGALEGVSFLLGDRGTVERMPGLAALEPFDEGMLGMLSDVSRILMADRGARAYPDVVTFAFWIRRAGTLEMKERWSGRGDGCIRLGRGTAFHIAPSNVPVNFAYSLAAGLLTGNANIVRVPSEEFPQVRIIAGAFAKALGMERNRGLADRVCLVRYGRDRRVNDLFSSIADVRIVWGGDRTIEEIRRSPLGPRAGEVTFADRFSIAVIDSDAYLDEPDKGRLAEGFYNDTYLTDQNACTSPRLVAWLGKRREEAKEEFWGRLHGLVKEEYPFQPVQGVDKLTRSCLAAVAYMEGPRAAGAHAGDDGGVCQGPAGDSGGICQRPFGNDSDVCRGAAGNGQQKERTGVWILPHADNLLVRVGIPRIMDGLMDLRGDSGQFFEYDCDDVLELKGLCDDRRCQTIAYIGSAEMLRPLLLSGIRGVDRVVPVGRTMDFELTWDGHDLYEELTRVIVVK